MRDIKKGLGWQLGKVVGCLVSHRHEDHARSLNDFLTCGIRVLALADVFDAANPRNRVFCKIIEPMHGYKVGGFKVFVLPVVHDVPCVGFVIEHQEMGRLLFITDTMMLEYRLPNLNHIMIEANYSDAILQRNIDSGRMPPAMRGRLLGSHMELQTTKEILRTTDLSAANEVILLHLSDGNSNAKGFAEDDSKTLCTYSLYSYLIPLASVPLECYTVPYKDTAHIHLTVLPIPMRFPSLFR